MFHVYVHLSTSCALDTMYKPQFDYTDIVWYNTSNMLENLHLEAMRIILGAVRGTSHEKLFKECGFCTLKERRKRHKLLMFHKMINHQCLEYLSNLVPLLVSTTNPYHRRRPHERVFPAHKTELYANSIIPSTTQLWNTLPQTIQTNPSISLLKKYSYTLWFLYIIILVLERNKLSTVDTDLLLAI